MTSITRRHLLLDTLTGAAVAGFLSNAASASSTSASSGKLPRESLTRNRGSSHE